MRAMWMVLAGSLALAGCASEASEPERSEPVKVEIESRGDVTPKNLDAYCRSWETMINWMMDQGDALRWGDSINSLYSHAVSAGCPW